MKKMKLGIMAFVLLILVALAGCGKDTEKS